MSTNKTNIDDTNEKLLSSTKIKKTDLTRIHNFKDSRGITSLVDGITELLDQTVFVNLSAKDTEKLHAAALAGNTTFEALCITGALQYADRLLSAIDKTGNADTRINKFVADLIEANNAADHDDKIGITQGYISNVGGFNRESIKRFMIANKTMIDDHHAANGIDDPTDHNRKVATKKRLIENKQKRELQGG
jgi:hypothetical protein